MRTLRMTVAVAGLAIAAQAAAAPYHGCTFFRSELVEQSMLCASLNVVYPGCPLVKCSPLGCIVYAGALFTGWMPEYFLEVTNRAGESVFTSADMPEFKVAMGTAASHWREHGDLSGGVGAAGLSTTSDQPRGGHDFSMYFGRALPVPYGPVGWTVNSVPTSAGTAVPTCFSAISEYAAETWADRMDSGDRWLAAQWAPITGPACGGFGGAMGAIAAFPMPSASLPSSIPCAFPLSVGWQSVAAKTGQSALDPSKQCMGSLGGLLPRTGFTEGGTYTAAERVAWRTASLAEDYFKTGVGVQGSDRWQIIHPASSGMCFPPGSLLRPSPLTGSEVFLRNPAYDEALVNEHETDYVFAVWRFRSKCLEPPQYPAALAEIRAYQGIHTAACSAMNAVTGIR